MKTPASLTLAAAVCCSAPVVLASADTSATEQELLAVDAAFSAYSAAHGMAAAFTAFAAENAFKFDPASGVVRGREGIRNLNKDVPADFVLIWTPLSAEAAASGDMGYTFGRYESHRTLPDGSVKRGSGHYMTLWKRQADGTWKWIFDSGVADPKPEAPGAPPQLNGG